MQEEQPRQEKGPLPRTREAVDWWLKKWGRQAVLDSQEPMTREDVERLIEINGGTAEGLYLFKRNLSGIELLEASLRGAILAESKFYKAMIFSVDLQEAELARANFHGANLNCSDLRDANLFSADFSKAYMIEVKLQGAKLTHADLRDANLKWVEISHETDLEGVKWGKDNKDFVSVLERQGDYEAAVALYRRLKEWYRGLEC